MGRSKNAKRPAWAPLPSPTKHPRVEEDPDFRNMSVVWVFATFDNGVDWRDQAEGNSHCTFCEVVEHLKACEGRTWAQIEADRGRDHAVPVSGLIPDARKRLADIGLDDTEELWRLRFSGRMRIWGIRDRRFLKVIWWDPHHVICPSHKRHT